MLSLAARAAWLGQPCRTPCHSAADHVLIFDETYYVNAARAIAGLPPPSGAQYAHPAGEDPNAEHPQLAKLIIAASIQVLGDGPLAWRLGSLVLGSVAILGMFALVRAAGGGQWIALGAAALMACDNLMRIGGVACPGPARAPAAEIEILGLAWFLATFLPFELLSRTSYLYYVLLVMPGIYVAVAAVVAGAQPGARMRMLWILAVIVAVVLMYPFAPLP